VLLEIEGKNEREKENCKERKGKKVDSKISVFCFVLFSTFSLLPLSPSFSLLLFSLSPSVLLFPPSLNF
jgi:hypothetical protein